MYQAMNVKVSKCSEEFTGVYNSDRLYIVTILQLAITVVLE